MNVVIGLPPWLSDEAERLKQPLETIEDRMREVIRFSKLNFEHNTGGPFAAGVFEEETGKLIAMGINRVVPSNCSSAHAEVVALSLAQQSLGNFDLGSDGLPRHQLVVNWRPCAMCYGAVVWSGVRSLVIAGSDGQLEEITGFDEGPIHPHWEDELAKRGIELTQDILKADACDVFRSFRDSGRLVYNGRGGS